MKKNVVLLIVTVIIAGLLSGCGEIAAKKAERKTISLDRQATYKKIAIVCAPQGDASPEYIPQIIGQIQAMTPSRLGYFLDKVICVKDATVDLSSSTPVVSFPGKEEYDGIVCTVYGYDKGLVTMDIMMLDGQTGESIWSHRFETEDPDIRGRLYRHGYYVATVVKRYFYGYDQ